MSDSNDWIREVNGKVDHGIMTFDFLKTNEAKVKTFFGSCRKLKNKDHVFCKLWNLKNKDFIFLQTLES